VSSNLRGREPREKRVEFRLSESELEALEEAAFEQDCSVSHLVRAALRKHLGFSRGGGTHARKARKERDKKKAT